jgi:uncharacterized OB-fold protein
MTQKPNFLKPTNLESPAAKKFWDGLRAGQFLAPRCVNCGKIFFPPRSHCPECLEEDFAWEELDRKGILYSWTELSFVLPEFDAPFLLGLVDLADGAGRIIARISGETAEGLYIGMPLIIRISDPGGGMALYYVEPLR